MPGRKLRRKANVLGPTGKIKSEEVEHVNLAHILRIFLPNRFHHSPNGGWRHIRTAVMFKKMGVSAGFPDIFILGSPQWGLPSPGCVIEMKSMKGRASPEQMEWIEEFRKSGFHSYVCKGSWQAVDTLMKIGYLDYGEIKKSTALHKRIADELIKEYDKYKLLLSE